MYSYDTFSEETKAFLHKAMDIYSTIMDTDIKKRCDDFGRKIDYSFTKLDKRILSLYIAGFLINGDLKDILDLYDDIRVEDLLSFINLTEREIKTLTTDEYREFYNRHFKLDFISILKERSKFFVLIKITPEVIYSSLSGVTVNESSILNYLGKACKINTFWFHEHPSFNAARALALEKGDLHKKELSKKDARELTLLPIVDSSLKPKKKPAVSLTLIDNSKNDELGEDEMWSILDDIQKKFIGQETAAEYLFYNIINNQQLAKRDDVIDGERSIIFLDGPTGTGKTAITREITEKLDIPYTSTSITNYSSTGYVGGDITDTLKELLKKSNGDIEKAQSGIIVFDEFDKIAYSRKGGLEMKRAVQQQLLDFMGGGKYNISFNMDTVQFDTSKLTFICLGALSELRATKTEKRQPIGFRNTELSSNTFEYTITPQDLESIGLEPELIGRLNTYLHTEEYSEEALLRILRESTISPIIGFNKWLTSNGKTLQIGDGVYEAIASAAYNLSTGARGLQTIMNNIRTPFLRKVLREKDTVIYLDLETVLEIIKNTTTRKSIR